MPLCLCCQLAIHPLCGSVRLVVTIPAQKLCQRPLVQLYDAIHTRQEITIPREQRVRVARWRQWPRKDFDATSAYSNHVLPSAIACARKNAFTALQSTASNKSGACSCSARSK
jgi:hypothetical protein